jgi:hypothetical protein
VHRRFLAASLATLVLAVSASVALGASATAAATVSIGLRSFSISKSASSVRHGSIAFDQAERALLHGLLRHPPVADAHVVPGDVTALLHGLHRDLEELD